jgi:hypothetical protein
LGENITHLVKKIGLSTKGILVPYVFHQSMCTHRQFM